MYAQPLFWGVFMLFLCSNTPQHNGLQLSFILDFVCCFNYHKMFQSLLSDDFYWFVFGLCNTFFSDGIISWCLNIFIYLFKAQLCIFICKTTHMSTNTHALLLKEMLNIQGKNKFYLGLLGYYFQIFGRMYTGQRLHTSGVDISTCLNCRF